MDTGPKHKPQVVQSSGPTIFTYKEKKKKCASRIIFSSHKDHQKSGPVSLCLLQPGWIEVSTRKSCQAEARPGPAPTGRPDGPRTTPPQSASCWGSRSRPHSAPGGQVFPRGAEGAQPGATGAASMCSAASQSSAELSSSHSGIRSPLEFSPSHKGILIIQRGPAHSPEPGPTWQPAAPWMRGRPSTGGSGREARPPERAQSLTRRRRKIWRRATRRWWKVGRQTVWLQQGWDVTCE